MLSILWRIAEEKPNAKDVSSWRTNNVEWRGADAWKNKLTHIRRMEAHTDARKLYERRILATVSRIMTHGRRILAFKRRKLSHEKRMESPQCCPLVIWKTHFKAHKPHIDAWNKHCNAWQKNGRRMESPQWYTVDTGQKHTDAHTPNNDAWQTHRTPTATHN